MATSATLQSAAVDKPILNQFAGLLLSQAGLHFSAHNMSDLEAGIKSTLQSHAFSSPGLLLSAMSGKTEEAKQYFDTLVRAVTIGETYFMRYPEQFAVLREDVFPELIARRRKRNDLYLRLWSAGCASGEEAYSLAITLRELLPDFDQWNIQILATDINRDSLAKVEAGDYGAWSFRGVAADTLKRHFVQKDKRYEINPELKRKVHPQYLNLRDDCYPSLLTSTTAMDFIFCRNVLIYFSELGSKHVVDRLNTCLIDGGHLMVGPVEPNEELFRGFHSRFLKGTMLYQRPDGAEDAVAQPPAQKTPAPPQSPNKSALKLALVPRKPSGLPLAVDPEALLQLAQTAWRDGHLEVARQHLEKALALDPTLGEALFLAALIEADRGHFDEAAAHAHAGLAVLPTDVRLQHLAAIIATERGEHAAAMGHLKKAIFLDRHFALGHFGMAVALRREGQTVECAKYLKNTLALLDNYPDDATLPGVEEIAAGWLKKVAKKYLTELNAVGKN